MAWPENLLLQLDRALYHRINQPGLALLDPFMVLISDGRLWWGVGIAITLGLVIRPSKKLWVTWGLVILTLIITDATTYWILKQYFQRLRPCHHLDGVRFIIPACGAKWGFPSNHAANGMAMSTIFYLMLKGRLSKYAFLMTVLVGISRVYLGVHYPLDVLAGFLVGASLAALIYSLFRYANRRSTRRSLAPAAG